MFNDYWMIDQGFIEREQKGDLSDLVSRRHDEDSTVTVSAEDNLLIAYGRMKPYDISQLPVLDKNGEVVGIVYRSEERRVGKECVSTCRIRWSPDASKKKKPNT